MTTLIRDLIHFEQVEEVIKLRKAEQAAEMVEKYVISEGLRSNLTRMFTMLDGSAHKSFNVVGNYGTGKSHFLVFVAALLEHPELRSRVRDSQVRAAAEKLSRRYYVVTFELGAAAEVPLRRIFFDQVYQQLLNRYGLEVKRVALERDYDNKQNILDILAAIKTEDPEAGLVVIVDEISDFLKQKSKEAMAYDLALLRELGEVSQDSDFLYVGAMQEHVFTNPKYTDQAESIARINQRFVTVTITKEDVARVLTERVVRKDADQRMRLQALLAEHKQYFTNLVHQLDQYVDLFPLHPYVIQVFEQLPYFENRGIIGFAVNNVAPILNQPAPRFITYDRVFDLIDATHEIRNMPVVSEVIKVIHTLESKVDLLDARYRDDAKKLVKALAVLKLLGGTHVNGATSQELANTLFITPPGKLLVQPEMATGHIERVMKNIRDVTVGQYIAYGEGRYWLDLTKIEDYDARIEQKAQASVDEHELDLAFRQIAEAELGFKDQKSLVAGLSLFDDSAPWPSHKSFRPGVLVIGKQDDGRAITRGDYRFVLRGPIAGQAVQHRQDQVILAAEFTDELLSLLTRARAAGLLANEGVHKKVMAKLSEEAAARFLEKYTAHLATQGFALHAGHRTSLADMPSRRPLNTLADIVDHVKGALLDQLFTDKYPNYPVFRTLITAANLGSEVTRTAQALDRATTQQMDMNSRGYLESLGAIKEGHFSASSSPACSLILDRLTANDAVGKMTPLEDMVREFEQPPWGLPRELVHLLVGALVFNGHLILIRQGGARLRAGDVSGLIKGGLDFFQGISYLERDKDIDAEGAAALFNLLELQAGLVRDKDSRSEAVKELRLRGQALKERVATVRSSLQAVVGESAAFPQMPWLSIQKLHGGLAWLDVPLAEFAAASRVSELGKLDTSGEFRQALRARLSDLETLAEFLSDWKAGLASGLKRLNEAMAVLPSLEPLASADEQSAIADLRRIAADSQAIYADERQLLRSDYRRPLRGKLEQFHKKYNQLYYGLHQRVVGDQAAWERLEALRSSPRYAGLNRLKSLPFISPAEFNQAALELQALERRRCRAFNAQVLDSFVACPYCKFPQDGGAASLPARLDEIEKRLDELWGRWAEQVFNELPGLEKRLTLLSPARRKLVDDLTCQAELPEAPDDDLLAALHELASELQPVELDVYDLARAWLERGGALTVDELRAGWEAYLAALLKGYRQDLVRVKIKLLTDEPG